MNTPHENDRPSWAEPDEPASYLASRRIKQQLLDELSEPVGPSRAELDDILGRWPTELTEDPDVAGAIFQDFRHRSVRGEPLSRSDYEQKYPEHKDSLGKLLRRQDFLRSVTSATDPITPLLALPKVGDELFGFRLRHQLGQGAFARVFLAEQVELAGRQVALKTSDLCGTEPQTLAQLQHTNIVPIYSVHEDAAAGIRAVCMPYFGGAALSQILRTVWENSEHPKQGAEIVAALAAVATSILLVGETADVEQSVGDQADVKLTTTTGEPPVATKFAKLDYSHACAWIVARLAEGLQHAHDRGVLHRDIKPSNILIGGDGTPMILDFNLAHDESQPQAQVEATLGGTVAYMAPEHLRALNIRSRELIKAVDHRADIYGLGMVLFEMIAGHNPFDHQASYSPMPILLEAMASERSRSIPSMRQFSKDVSWSLESIVRKCLAPNPDQRYQRAEDLAEDLDRLLDDRPLKHAPELSRIEQIQKCVRRHPRLMSSLLISTAAAGLLTISGLLLTGTQAKLAAAQTRVESTEQAEAQQRKQDFERGTLKALCLINTHSDLKEHAIEGRSVCESTLAIYGILNNADWEQQSIWTRLSDVEQQQLAEDARELLLCLAGVRAQLATGSHPTELASVETGLRTTHQISVVQRPEIHRDPTGARLGGVSVTRAGHNEPNDNAALIEALALLERADKIHDLPASAAVWQAKAVVLRELGNLTAAVSADQYAASIPPSSARDFYLVATAHLQSNAADRHLRAIVELEQAVRLDPKNYWAWMQKGLCHLELHEHPQALADFGVCVGLWPEFAWGYFNRGYALDQIGKKQSAIADYSAAVERESNLIPAYHNRGLARLELGQSEAALADFDVVAEKHSDAVIQSLRGQALERLARHVDADAAFAAASDELDAIPDVTRNQLSCSYGFAVCSRLPTEAKRAFQRVPAGDPKYPEALYGLAMLAVNEDRPERAVELFGKALAIRPTFEEARRFRAVLLARLQQFSEAVSEINVALQAAPKSGAILYAAACVISLTSEHAGNPTAAQHARDESLRFLRQALERGYGRQAATDNDLAGLRQHPDFEMLLLKHH